MLTTPDCIISLAQIRDLSLFSRYVPPFPNLDQTVTATSDKPPEHTCSRPAALWRGQLSWRDTGCPRHGVYADRVRGEDLMCPAVVAEFKNRDGSVAGCAS